MNTVWIEQAGRRLSLDGDDGLYSQETLDVRGYAPDTGVQARSVLVSTPSRQVEVDVAAIGEQPMLDLLRVGQASLSGITTTLHVDDHYQRVAIVKFTADEVRPRYSRAKLVFQLLDGVWLRDGDTVTMRSDDAAVDVQLDHPYDFPYDYGRTAAQRFLRLTGSSSADVLLRIRLIGPAASAPSMTINGNVYQYNATLAAGESVLVDPVDRTAVKTDANGTTRDVFAELERGDGLDRGRYFFQPIPFVADRSYPVVFDADCDVEITPIYREVGLW